MTAEATAPELAPAAADLAEIDAFCDALWLEDGLARASLASYRSDLLHLARWLRAQVPALGIDRSRVVLAVDSAGAQIAAELANAITSTAHARRIGIEPALPPAALAGTLLYCGPYDVALLRGDGPAA